MFPRLLRWNDAHFLLVSRFAGSPLGMDVAGWDLPNTYAQVAADARRNGLATPEEQFKCMRKQLKMAGVTHLDMGCKNIYLHEGALTLGDFDAALVDGFPAERLHQKSRPPHSDEEWIWRNLKQRDAEWANPTPSGLCFRHAQAVVPPVPGAAVFAQDQTALERVVPPVEFRRTRNPTQHYLEPLALRQL